MKWTQKALAVFLAAAMAVTMAAPAFAKTDKNNLRYLDIVDSDGENAYYDRTDTIKPGDKYYIIIGKSTGTDLDNLLDKKLFTFRLKKKDGGKYISGADIVEKRFGNTRYICIESPEIISPSRRCASRMPSRVLPVAVGPVITASFCGIQKLPQFSQCCGGKIDNYVVV